MIRFNNLIFKKFLRSTNFPHLPFGLFLFNCRRRSWEKFWEIRSEASFFIIATEGFWKSVSQTTLVRKWTKISSFSPLRLATDRSVLMGEFETDVDKLWNSYFSRCILEKNFISIISKFFKEFFFINSRLIFLSDSLKWRGLIRLPNFLFAMNAFLYFFKNIDNVYAFSNKYIHIYNYGRCLIKLLINWKNKDKIRDKSSLKRILNRAFATVIYS